MMYRSVDIGIVLRSAVMKCWKFSFFFIIVTGKNLSFWNSENQK